MVKASTNVKITNELKNPTDPGVHHRLLCMTGPNKGKVYYLIGKRIIIGRGDEADIQIADTKISREHAELSFAENGYTITDLGAQNGVIVNDTKIKQKKLLDSEKIVIGQTVFKYSLIDNHAGSLVAKETSAAAPAKSSKVKTTKSSSGGSNFGRDTQFSSSSNFETKKGPPKMLIMSAVVGVVLFVLLGKDDQPQRPKEKANQIDDFAPIEKSKPPKEDAEVKKKFNNLLHSGRREFSEGNYFRAMEDFRLALLLNPQDGHASFYLSKAKQRLDEDIEKNFLKGKQEYEAKKLQSAIVSYCSVVQLIQNYPNDERYKNAMMKISAIESELGMEKGEIKCFEEKPNDAKN